MRPAGRVRVAIAGAAVATVLAVGAPPASAVVGGHKAAEGEFPFMLSLEHKGPRGFTPSCGAVLIAPHAAVTAAHCVETVKPSLLRIRSGTLSRTTGGHLTNVKAVLTHPNYYTRNMDNDIALLQLSKPIPDAEPAALPKQGFAAADGAPAVIAGWGTTSFHPDKPGVEFPASLMTADTSVVDRAECRKDYSVDDITDQMGCTGVPAGRIGFCQGDDGGPVISDGVLIGLYSHSYGCAVKGKASVHTRVGSFVSWIRDNEE